MSTTTATTTTPASGALVPATPSGGTTTIADGVVAKIAGIAVRSVPGVQDLGGAAGRAVGALRGRIGQTDLTRGVSVEVGDTQVAVDVSLVAAYPARLQQVADDVRSSVIEAVETYVGKEVTEVNVTISDVRIPSEKDGDDDPKGR